MDVNEADELVKAYGDAQARCVLLGEACPRSSTTRGSWLPLLRHAERERNEAATAIRRALLQVPAEKPKLPHDPCARCGHPRNAHGSHGAGCYRFMTEWPNEDPEDAALMELLRRVNDQEGTIQLLKAQVKQADHARNEAFRAGVKWCGHMMVGVTLDGNVSFHNKPIESDVEEQIRVRYPLFES
jgi:hypothetical protein